MNRPPYLPPVLRDTAIPSVIAEDLEGRALPIGRVLIGAFHASSPETGIWRRLIVEGCTTVYFGCTIEDVRSVTPPSAWARTGTSESTGWLELIQPDRPERAFAAVIAGGTAGILVIGAPTEDVWEEFEGGILPI